MWQMKTSLISKLECRHLTLLLPAALQYSFTWCHYHKLPVAELAPERICAPSLYIPSKKRSLLQQLPLTFRLPVLHVIIVKITYYTYVSSHGWTASTPFSYKWEQKVSFIFQKFLSRKFPYYNCSEQDISASRYDANCVTRPERIIWFSVLSYLTYESWNQIWTGFDYFGLNFSWAD